MNKKKKEKLTMRLGLACILLTVVACAGIKIKEYYTEKQQEKEVRLIKERAEQKKREKEEQIKAVLSEEEYRAELTALYEKYPQMESIFLNRDEYPDWVVAYLVEHEEAVDWVVGYPDYMAKTEEERLELAQAAIPQEEETQNGIPMLFQWDQRWGYFTYGNGPIAIEGCGPTCLSMAIVGLTGDRSATPNVVAEYAMKNGYYVEESGTSWSLMMEGAKAFGLTGSQITQWSADYIKSVLNNGKVVVCSVGEGDFTTQGHFILLVGVNDDGTVMVNDPNNRENCQTSWEISRILGQAKGLWELGA